MSDLEIPDRAYELAGSHAKRGHGLTGFELAAPIIIAAELRRMATKSYCWTDQHVLSTRADELDPPERTN